MVIQVAARTDIGCHRDKNEDSYYIDPDNGLYIVCDGMGGHLAGEVASQKAIEYTVKFLSTARRHRILPQKYQTDFREVWGNLIVEAIENCCDEVMVFAESHPEFNGMATTLTVVQIVEGVAFVGHLGDSRLYLKNRGVAKQLTSDHTLFEEFARANPNWINSNSDPDALSRFKHILTRCVGRERTFEVESFSFQLANDDVLLLCTDGLSNHFEEDETIFALLNTSDVSTLVDSLVEFANSSGGQDNITAIVIKVQSLAESELREYLVRSSGIEDTQEWIIG